MIIWIGLFYMLALFKFFTVISNLKLRVFKSFKRLLNWRYVVFSNVLHRFSMITIRNMLPFSFCLIIYIVSALTQLSMSEKEIIIILFSIYNSIYIGWCDFNGNDLCDAILLFAVLRTSLKYAFFYNVSFQAIF